MKTKLMTFDELRARIEERKQHLIHRMGQTPLELRKSKAYAAMKHEYEIANRRLERLGLRDRPAHSRHMGVE